MYHYFSVRTYISFTFQLFLKFEIIVSTCSMLLLIFANLEQTLTLSPSLCLSLSLSLTHSTFLSLSLSLFPPSLSLPLSFYLSLPSLVHSSFFYFLPSYLLTFFLTFFLSFFTLLCYSSLFYFLSLLDVSCLSHFF